MTSGNMMVNGSDKVLDRRGTCPSCHADALEDVDYCTNWGIICSGVMCHFHRDYAPKTCPNLVTVVRCKCGYQESRF